MGYSDFLGLMIALGVLAAVLGVVLPVLVIYLLAGQSRLKRQVAALEHKMHRALTDSQKTPEATAEITKSSSSVSKPEKIAVKVVQPKLALDAASVIASRKAETKIAVAETSNGRLPFHLALTYLTGCSLG